MSSFTFAPATRETAKARIALQGPGGSGKTKTALRFAETLAAGGQIGLIDTERGSALKYAPVPGRPDLGGHEFGHMPMSFCSPENLIAAVKAAEEARLAVLIVDSWSHFWAGKGGLLARVETESKKPEHRGGKYTAWAPVNELEQDMLDALLGFPGHVIVTMRTKNDYEMEGKKVTKIGVKTVQREGAEYEVDVVIDMVEGTGTVTKTRYEGLADITVRHPGLELAETILEQLGQGVDPMQVIVDAIGDADLTLDGVLELQADAARRRLMANGLLHPADGQPTTLAVVLQERLGDIVTDILAAKTMTYDAALQLYQRAERGGWLTVPCRPDAENSEAWTLGEVIKARGSMLKPKAAAPPVAATPTPDPTPQSTAGPGTTAAPATAPAAASPAPEPTAPAASSDGATPPQMRKIFATLKDLGCPEDRDRRLKAVSLLLGRQVLTMNDLSFGEAGELIEILDSFTSEDRAQKFRDELNDLLAKAQKTQPAADAA